MSTETNSVQTQENISSHFQRLPKGASLIKKVPSSRYDNDQISQNTEMSSPKQIKRLSFDSKMAASISETLNLNAKKSIDLERDRKNYQLKCESIINRIEVMRKQERDMKKRITKLNRQKVAVAKVQAEKLHRYQEIEDIKKDKDEEIKQKKQKAQEDRLEELSALKEIGDKLKEEKKMKYEKRVKERKRASSYVNECKRQIEEDKKVVCKKLREDLVDPIEIKKALRVNKEVKRNSTMEKKIEHDELFNEQLKKKLKELEKEEETVFHQVSNTIKNNEDMFQHSFFAYSSTDYMTFKANACKPAKVKVKTTISRKSSSFIENSENKIKELQQKYNERIKEFNKLIANDKLHSQLKKHK